MDEEQGGRGSGLAVKDSRGQQSTTADAARGKGEGTEERAWEARGWKERERQLRIIHASIAHMMSDAKTICVNADDTA
jgi:hypothetical protein